MDRLTTIVDRVSSGEMPPAKKPRPTPAELQAFQGWIRPRLISADRTRREVVQRRLNRVEYENTIRDLLAVDVELKLLLPEDQRAGGFDTNGEALAVSSELLGSYLEAAERALDEAIVHGPPPPSATWTTDARKDVENYLKSYSVIDNRIFIYQSEEGGYSKISSRARTVPSRGLYHVSFEAVTRNSEKPITFSVRASDFAPVSAISRTLAYYDATPTVRRFELDVVLDKAMAVQFFLGNANGHLTANLPIVLAGGPWKHGQHLAFDAAKNYPLARLFVSMMQGLGLEVGSFASGAGTMQGLELKG